MVVGLGSLGQISRRERTRKARLRSLFHEDKAGSGSQVERSAQSEQALLIQVLFRQASSFDPLRSVLEVARRVAISFQPV